MINETKMILEELNKTSEGFREREAETLLSDIIGSKRVFVTGGGRSELVASAFAMRLMQLGMESFVVGDPTTPAITENDMLLAVSGSGDTETVYDMVCEAKKKKAMVWCITAKRNSRIAGRSDKAIIIHGKTKLGKGRSAQPLGSLFEQAALIYMDSLVVMIMERLGEEEGELRKRHTTLE